ncbi:hypothetical protein MMYC01_202308 [Madurella mycetomatis]|uniref:Uncharacterized protein n=1 Tax=Madurella mycetomatis TaxID=100816 RepID=A0A175W8I3_9PEZI|nr:hypothetical protein MMYC01_202308 [Madurella mycetomatis]
MDLSPPSEARWPVDSADPAGCKLAGEFFATWMTSPEQIEAETYRGPGLAVTVEYLRILYNVDERAFSDGELLRWFADTQKQAEIIGGTTLQEFYDTVIGPAVNFCGASVCKSLGWSGNSDLAGIGVFSSYYIEAILATLYLIVLLARRFRIWSGSEGLSRRTMIAFLATIGDLVQGVFIFAIAIICASLHSILRVLEDDFSVTTYEVVTAVLVTIFAVCPATLLYSLGGNSKGPKPLLRVILFAVWVLMLAVVNIGRKTDPSREALQAGTIGHPFELYCQVIGNSPLEAVRIFAVVSAGLGALWLLYVIFGKRETADSEADKQDIRLWQVVISILACLVMWFFLGLFTAMRARIIEVAGDSDASNEWSFGQIVALATWAPVILNFFYILFMGLEEGRGCKLPDGFAITESSGK